jgi:hypothetical protein
VPLLASRVRSFGNQSEALLQSAFAQCLHRVDNAGVARLSNDASIWCLGNVCVCEGREREIVVVNEKYMCRLLQ